jgi:hypothetical protein
VCTQRKTSVPVCRCADTFMICQYQKSCEYVTCTSFFVRFIQGGPIAFCWHTQRNLLIQSSLQIVNFITCVYIHTSSVVGVMIR